MPKPLKVTLKDHHADNNQTYAICAIRTKYDISKARVTYLVQSSWILNDTDFANTIILYLDKNCKVHPVTNAHNVDEMLNNMQYYMEYCKSNAYVTPQDWITNYKHF